MNIRNAVLLFIFSLTALLVFIHRPSQPIFDEKFYIPAARGLLAGKADANFQHPPLAKEFVALGIEIFGDSPLGWRFFSAVLGAVTLCAVYFLALLFFETQFSALATVVLVFCNGLFFILSRLAMLEIFSSGFALAATAAFLFSQKNPLKKVTGYLFFAGSLFGLAAASKWSALVPFAICIAGGLVCRRLSAKSWLCFLSSAVVFYLLPFFILCATAGGNLSSVLSAQIAMWEFHHPAALMPTINLENTSAWWQWPFQLQPLWLAILPPDIPNPFHFISVMIAGNPLVIFGGWLGILVLLKKAWQDRSQGFSKSTWIVVLALGPLLVWALVQRTVTYYYYFFPTSVFLCFALVAAIYSAVQNQVISERRAKQVLTICCGLAGAYFLYLWPLMSAQEISRAQFENWYPFFRLFGE